MYIPPQTLQPIPMPSSKPSHLLLRRQLTLDSNQLSPWVNPNKSKKFPTHKLIRRCDAKKESAISTNVKPFYKPAVPLRERCKISFRIEMPQVGERQLKPRPQLVAPGWGNRQVGVGPVHGHLPQRKLKSNCKPKAMTFRKFSV